MGLLALAIATGVLLLLMLGSIWGMNVAAARIVGDKHHLLQEIVETGGVPAPWRKRYERRIASLRGDPHGQEKLVRLLEAAQQDYLRKLDGLIQYAHKTTLVEDEEARCLLLERLNAVRLAWETSAR